MIVFQQILIIKKCPTYLEISLHADLYGGTGVLFFYLLSTA